MMKSWLAASVVALALAAAPALALSPAESGEDVRGFIELQFGDAAPFVEAFEALQTAVAADDAAAFASWIAYPFHVKIDGETYDFDSEEGVIEHYDSMMTDEIRSAILDQAFDEMLVSPEGMMFGQGQVWLTGICTTEACDSFDVRIIAVQSTAN